MTSSLPVLSLLLLSFSLFACSTCSDKPASAPEADPEIAAARAETEPKDTSPGEKEEPKETSKAAVPVEELPEVSGFGGIAFGLPLDKAKKDKSLRKRCTKRPIFAKTDPENPKQKIEEWFASCDAEFAGRKMDLTLLFDHNKEVYSITFDFDGGVISEIQPLIGDEEISKFIAEVRGVLDGELGEPIDESTESLGTKTYRLEWNGRTTDEPPHEIEVSLVMESAGITTQQYVRWKDLTREKAMEDAIEKERQEGIKSKGL